MAQARSKSRSSKKGTTNRRKTGSKGGGLSDEILLLLVLCISSLLLLSTFGLLGKAGKAVGGLGFGLFGIGAFLIPFVIFFLVLFWLSNKGKPVVGLRVTATITLVIVLCSLIHLITMKNTDAALLDYFSICSEERRGGGLIGAAIGLLLSKIIGRIGSYILLIAILLICGVVITERSLIAFIKSGSKSLVDRQKENAKLYKEYRESLNEDYSREQEKRERLREIRDRERLERAREKEEERLQRKKERALKREEQLEQRIAEAEEREREAREKRRRRSEMKVVGVSMDTNLTSKNKIYDEIHEIKYDLSEEDSAALNIKRVHQIALDQEERADVIYDEENSEDIYDIEDYSSIKKSGSNERINPNNSDPKEAEIIPSNIRRFDLEDIDPSKEEEELLTEMNADIKISGNVSRTEGLAKASRSSDLVIEKPLKEEIAKEQKGFEELPVKAESLKEEVRDRGLQEDRAEFPDKRELFEHSGNEPFVEEDYMLPRTELLDLPERKPDGESLESLRATAAKLKDTLGNFGVNVEMTEISRGPTVTRFEMVPQTGVKVSKILGLSDDIKLNMAAMDVRIEAPIPGKAAIGIEIPNKTPSPVHFREIIEDKNFKDAASKITFGVGKDIEGRVVVTDIAKMPHLLIAGATGSGKSVCINTLIMSILYKARPDEVKLIMIDPKVVELSVYNGIPHLMIPVVTDPRKASAALQWGVAEMTDRYNKFAEYGVRDMKGYNKRIAADFKDVPEDERPKKMPQIVIIVDELADLMMVASKEVEESICRIAQLARAAGIHLVIATQRPSVDVITGLIKANMPSRIAFSVSSGTDSRTILDMVGAEKLLGKGDMLFYPQGYSKPARLQGAFVNDDEVSRVVSFLKEQGNVEYDPQVLSKMAAQTTSGANDQNAGAAGTDDSGRDELFVQAARTIIEKEKASIGMLQRMFRIGFNRAARIMDQLAEAGVVSEEQGTKPRDILMSQEQFDQYVEEYL
ncbi:MAG: DNA translocase FtsK [Lachnospiraceae bacterium]|nr:DNA translocase FtsK [Lachnospiraceae bacterium]